MEKHFYVPDVMAMGDCRRCGHVADAPHHAKPLTRAQHDFLLEAVGNHLGVAKCTSINGLGRKSQRAKAQALCDMGLMRRYVHGSDEFEITDAGRKMMMACDQS